MKKRQSAKERIISNKRFSALTRKINAVLKSEGFLLTTVSEIDNIIKELESSEQVNKNIYVKMHNARKMSVQNKLNTITLRREKLESLLADYKSKNESINAKRYGR